jgi:hypothetical protein
MSPPYNFLNEWFGRKADANRSFRSALTSCWSTLFEATSLRSHQEYDGETSKEVAEGD